MVPPMHSKSGISCTTTKRGKKRSLRFLTTCRAKMGNEWRERFQPVTEFFRSKHNLGHALRFDHLTEEELNEEKEKQKMASQLIRRACEDGHER